MNWAKLDAPLAGALAEQVGEVGEVGPAGEHRRRPRPITVFVHLDPEAGAGPEPTALERFGLALPPDGARTVTATLNPDQLDQLSEQPWVLRVQLSAPLRLLGEG